MQIWMPRVHSVYFLFFSFFPFLFFCMPLANYLLFVFLLFAFCNANANDFETFRLYWHETASCRLLDAVYRRISAYTGV